MALANYTDLKTAIETWLERTGDTVITANADDIVNLAESRMNFELKGLRTTTVDDATLTSTIGSREIDISSLPFLSPHSVFLTTFGVQDKLRPFIPGNFELGTSNTVPTAWAINGTNLIFDVPTDQAHTLIFRYYKQLDLQTDTTNWLMTNAPGVYLNCCLAEASLLLHDRQSYVDYNAVYEQRRDRLMISEVENLRSVPAIVDRAMEVAGPYDIEADTYGTIN